MSELRKSILASDFVLKLAPNQIASSLNSAYGVNHNSDHWKVERLKGGQGGRWAAVGIELKNIKSGVECHLAIGVDSSLKLRLNDLHNGDNSVYIGIRIREENQLDLKNSRRSVYEEFNDVLIDWQEPHKFWASWKNISLEENLIDEEIERKIINEYVGSFKTLRGNNNV